MGQSALSQTRKRVKIGVCNASPDGEVGVSLWFAPPLLWRKEIGLIIPNLEAEQAVTLPGSTETGNRNKLTDVVTSLGKSCLFFVRIRIPGIGLPGDRDAGTVKLRGSCGVQSVIAGP